MATKTIAGIKEIEGELECFFVKGFEGIKCEDIIELEKSEVKGMVDEDRADPYEHRCTAGLYHQCLLYKDYIAKLKYKSLANQLINLGSRVLN